jgi:sentrin-specific protease 7
LFYSYFQKNEKYCQFPPIGTTGTTTVSVHTEDYFCLEDETFLNDVIIDFFFKWLQFDHMSEKDRDRTHIFSTFFYKRLTMRPPIQKNKLHPVEDDVNLTAAQKRYARVKRWTKQVNIFDKDFIVVPINEHSHWFVAVICFPGLDGCRDFETGDPCSIPARQQKATEIAAEKNRKNKARKKELGDKKVMQVIKVNFFS